LLSVTARIIVVDRTGQLAKIAAARTVASAASLRPGGAVRTNVRPPTIPAAANNSRNGTSGKR
jgi:hypothetical protein